MDPNPAVKSLADRCGTDAVRRQGGGPVILRSIRVVDFTTLLPGPYASLRLADLGAEVVKVEPPGGDPARSSRQAVAGQGVVFLANNRNKKSVTLDLKSDSGREAALRLARFADVVLEGFRPGVADRLGIGYAAVKEANPRVVYCSLTGYGQDGPMARRAGHDLNYLAASGMLSLLRDDRGNPIVPKVQLADLAGAVAASEAILGALFRREREGVGGYLDISFTQAVMGLLNTHALIERADGDGGGIFELGGSLLCYNLYQTKDGRFVSLGALEPKFWRAFCEAAQRPEWIPLQMTPASPDNPAYAEVAALFRGRGLAWWSEFAERVDCCLQPALDVGEAMDGDFARERQVASDLDTPSWGVLRQVHTHAGGQTPAEERPPTIEPPALGV